MRRLKVPWDYDKPGTKPNLPTPEGAELGRHMARFFDVETITDPVRVSALPERCHDCAFRLGSIPNQCASTMMTVTKCLIEHEPFYCHNEPERLCTGFVVLAGAKR